MSDDFAPPSLIHRPAAAPPAIQLQPARSGPSGELPEERGVASWIEYLRMCRRNAGTLVTAAILGALCGLLFVLPRTPVYQARTTIEVEQANDSTLGLRDASQQISSGIDAEINDLQTQIKIMTSDTLVRAVIARMEKTHAGAAHEDKSAGSLWRRIFHMQQAGTPSTWQDAARAAANSLNVREIGTTRLIEIMADSTDPQVAAAFVNTMADEYMNQKIEARWSSSQRTTERLTRALDDMRIKLERAEDALQSYARESGLMFTSDKSSVSDERLSQLQESLSAAQADRVTKQSRDEMLGAATPADLPSVISDASLAGMRDRLLELKRQQAELSATFTPEYSKVKKLALQISMLEAELQKQYTAYKTHARSELDEARGHERLLANAYAAQAHVVTQESEKKIHYDILKREVDSTRSLYDTMLARVKEAGIASAVRASNVRVVDEARPPSVPYKPRIPQSVLIGLLSGFCVGAVFVISRERADRSIQAPGDINVYLGVPELGVIPAAATEPKDLIESGKQPKAVLTLLPATEPAPALPERVELVTWQHKPSMLAEAFRGALTSLLFLGQNGSRPRVLVMTSANPGEGKTTITTNLAIALSEIGQKVLLIDGDLRRPRLHDVFQVDQQPGLSEIMLGSEPLTPAAAAAMVKPVLMNRVFLLPSGASTSAATNLLYSPRMKELLQWARKEFDMVLIDTPPMLQIPDARVFGRAADAIILVVRAGRTTRDAALAVRQRLAEDGTRVAGSILNDWNPKKARAGYYGSQAYGYNYQAGNYQAQDSARN